ncbi:transcriptional regulator [Longispora fulva]|uniref:DNA-binding HxlR family transcriptional regulator n=1 Tax=Longispora fulva TaxID=619741 RepID=A0A8J7GMH8_9ACTN|nr:helix-turn-helix domain-containing protein [Longispora fulva]MBG6138290.1 DNA-binding HxlR family transcriptional regulator [Longispora fulva]GIG60541.1 transcriptional regulator [Longispora fulva]
MPGYGQFCPIAQAAEVLTERWTPLVIRELALTGSCRFNDIQRGVPLMSSSLLSKRLRQLERAGIVEHRQREYHLTPAGQELGPVIAQIGIWSERWLRRPIFEETPDTGLLMWWIRTTVKCDLLPAGRTVVHFNFLGAPEKLRYFWLVLPEADLCLSDPGFGVDITVRSDPKTLTAVWVGDLGLAAALGTHAVELEGQRTLVRSFPRWFGLHPLFATVDHPASRPRLAA